MCIKNTGAMPKDKGNCRWGDCVERGVPTNLWDTHPCGVKQKKMVCACVCLVAYAPRTLELCSKTRENVDGVIVWTGVCQHNGWVLRMAIFSCLINKNWVGGWILFLGKNLQPRYFNRAGAMATHL